MARKRTGRPRRAAKVGTRIIGLRLPKLAWWRQHTQKRRKSHLACPCMISYRALSIIPCSAPCPKTPHSEPLPPLNWPNALMFVDHHGAGRDHRAAGTDLRTASRPPSGSVAVLFTFLNGMAITAGYHRLWAHKTYEAHWSVRLFYLVFGTMALQNSVFAWCSGHRTHHLHVDDVDEDPYSARRGFWFSHIGWMLREYPSGQTDFSNIPDLKRDPMLAFQHRYYVPLLLLGQLRPAAARRAGLPRRPGACCSWRASLRLVWSHHVTFFINSLAHMWGSAALHRGEHRRATTRCWRCSPTARATTTSTTSSRTTTATACAGGSGTRPSGSSRACSSSA